MSTYQRTAGPMIFRVADGALIPADPANMDYVAYLAWVSAGNTADAPPPQTPQTIISAAEFLSRFLPAEELAIQAAAATNTQIALGLTMGLAKGQINLVSDPAVTAWMNALVTANCITSARMTTILTP